MSSTTNFVSKTQHYLKVKKPALERQRRARINKCLDALKTLVAEFQGNDDILRMDKAEMLETALVFMKTQKKTVVAAPAPAPVAMDSFRHGYMNAVNEVSRVMAAMPGMNVNIGTSVMTRLGSEFNRLLQSNNAAQKPLQVDVSNSSSKASALSPASSGYHSDCDESSPLPSPVIVVDDDKPVWRPW